MVQHGEQFQIAERERRGKEKREEVERIKNAGLDVADERHSAKEVRIPQRDHAAPPPLGGERVGGVEELREVAAARRHPHLPGEQPPEKAGSRRADAADGERISPRGVRAAARPRDSKRAKPEDCSKDQNHSRTHIGRDAPAARRYRWVIFPA